MWDTGTQNEDIGVKSQSNLGPFSVEQAAQQPLGHNYRETKYNTWPYDDDSISTTISYRMTGTSEPFKKEENTIINSIVISIKIVLSFKF